MDIGEAAQFVVVMLSPTLLIGSALVIPGAVRAVRRRFRRRRAGDHLQPVHPPIEQLAATLRRLLRRYETIRQATGMAMRARHLRAVEAAIGDCATQAAAALGLRSPDRSAGAALTTAELRLLLRELADAGLVLVPAPGLLAADDHG